MKNQTTIGIILTSICVSLLFALNVAAQGQESAIEKLPSGQTIEREMIGAETHRYKFDLKAGEFFQVRVEQKGVDVLLKILDSEGNVLATMDSPNSKEGPETLSFIAKQDGNYKLEISGFDEKSEKAIYTIKREVSRTATAKDKRRVEVERLFVKGMTARDTKGQSEITVKNFEKALLGWQELKDEYLIRLTTSQIRGFAESDLPNYPIFIEGVISFQKGTKESFEISRTKFKDAANYFTKNDKIYYAAISLVGAAQSEWKLGNLNSALGIFLESFPLFRIYEDKRWQGIVSKEIGSIYIQTGQNEKALEYLNQSLKFLKSENDKQNEGLALLKLGDLHGSLGEKQKALNYYNKSLILFRLIQDKSGEANTLLGISGIYLETGEMQKALEFNNQALPLFRETGNKNNEILALTINMAIYISLNEKQKLMDDAYKAMSLINPNDSEYKKTEVPIAVNLSEEIIRVFTMWLKSIPQVIRTGDKGFQSRTLIFKGLVDITFGKLEEAENWLTIASLLSKQNDDKGGQAIILTGLGSISVNRGNVEAAVNYYAQSLMLFKQIGEITEEATTLKDLLRILRLHNPRVAALYGKQSINKYQQLRQNIQGLEKETQKTYLKLVEDSYRKLADLLIQQNRLAEAHQVLNSFKDQQFFDFDKSQVKEPSPLTLTAREAEFVSLYEKASQRVGEVGGRLEELKRTIGTRQPTAEENLELQKLEREVKTASDEFLAVLKKAEVEFSKKPDAKDKVGEVPDLLEMRAALRKLNEQTGQKAVVVYQVVGEDDFSALVITPDSIEKVEVPFKGEQLNEKALQLWALLKSDRYDTTVLSKEIYDVVFAPLEAKLPKDTTTIMWATDGNLRYLPMAALFDGRRFLVERYTHSVFTRADSERMTRKVSGSWTGTGFGSSDAATVEVLGSKISFSALPGVTEELSEIFKNKNKDKGILNGETYSDKQFSKPNFIKALKTQRPLVHIASHFSFRPGDEARSFLLMGDQTAFTLEEMKREENLFKGVELLTLSACNTAATQPGANGREIDGFAELAQRLGAGAVMATMWQVSDASTPWLMRDFYATRETKTGMTKAEALQKAQLALLSGTAKTNSQPNARKDDSATEVKIVIVPDKEKAAKNKTRSDVIYLSESDAPLYKTDKNKPFAHPYYWSPFILFGNWR